MNDTIDDNRENELIPDYMSALEHIMLGVVC